MALLDGKTIIVTGAGRGVGKYIALLAAEEGANVVVNDLGAGVNDQEADAGPAEQVAEEIRAKGGNTIADTHSVAAWDSAHAIVENALDNFGELDGIVNNAGLLRDGIFHKMTRDDWHNVISVHLNGSFYGCKHAARVMMPRETGSIINMASTAGLLGGQGPHAYAVAKHGLIGLTKNVAAELCRYGIRVNCIAPAGMATAMVAGLAGDPEAIEATKARLAKASPLKGRPGLAEDVANAALWLASDESGYTNGLTLTTDAGVTTGSSVNAPPFDEHQPLIREAGKRGVTAD